jgi:hypothetical protein
LILILDLVWQTWFMQDEEYASFRAEQLATMRAEQEAEVVLSL